MPSRRSPKAKGAPRDVTDLTANDMNVEEEYPDLVEEESKADDSPPDSVWEELPDSPPNPAAQSQSPALAIRSPVLRAAATHVSTQDINVAARCFGMPREAIRPIKDSPILTDPKNQPEMPVPYRVNRSKAGKSSRGQTRSQLWKAVPQFSGPNRAPPKQKARATLPTKPAEVAPPANNAQVLLYKPTPPSAPAMGSVLVHHHSHGRTQMNAAPPAPSRSPVVRNVQASVSPVAASETWGHRNRSPAQQQQQLPASQQWLHQAQWNSRQMPRAGPPVHQTHHIPDPNNRRYNPYGHNSSGRGRVNQRNGSNHYRGNLRNNQSGWRARGGWNPDTRIR